MLYLLSETSETSDTFFPAVNVSQKVKSVDTENVSWQKSIVWKRKMLSDQSQECGNGKFWPNIFRFHTLALRATVE
jgi:hypothetical protein